MDWLASLGRRGLAFAASLGRAHLLLLAMLRGVPATARRPRLLLEQMFSVGVLTVLIIAVSGIFVGMVLGLQGYHNLKKFGSEELLGSAVALSLIQELGPVLTALMVIGRAGSAICAEIGIMRNSEQIDALECMAIDPFRYLIAPKLLAGIIAMPLLTAIFDVIGIIGGYLVGIGLFGISPGAYFQGMYSSVVWADVEMGLVKSLVFGLLMVWIAACKGFYLHMERSGGFGAEGVSRTTTDAVVLSSVSVLVWDYLISALLL